MTASSATSSSAVAEAEAGAGADRFARQRLIPGWDQSRLAAATAVVVGVGALGNEVAKNLALAGVGRLVLCDPDTVAPANLSRCVLFGPGDVGLAKVRAAAQALAALAAGTVVAARPEDLAAGVGLGELADAGVVLGCLDSRAARLRLLGRAALVGAVLVDGGTTPWGGEVRVRADVGEPCHGCSLTAGQRGEDDMPWSCSDAAADAAAEPAPASIASTSVVAGWMTMAALQVLFGGLPPYRMLGIDGAAGSTAPVTLRRDPDCPLHEPLDGDARELPELPVGPDARVADLLAALPAGAQPRVWEPFPVPGRCHLCGADYDHFAARRRGPSACAHCGREILVRRSEYLRDADPGRRLSDLGVPPGEILPVHVGEGELRCYRIGPRQAARL